jgi:glutamate dehydrogenase (NAD(P)+)
MRSPCRLAASTCHGAEKALHARGVLCVPDFISNAGGVICAAMEYRGATRSQVFDAIAEKIRANSEAVLREVRERKLLPRAAATDLAVRRVRRAMSRRRFGIL